MSLIAIQVAPVTAKFKDASGTMKRPPEKKKKGETAEDFYGGDGFLPDVPLSEIIEKLK